MCYFHLLKAVKEKLKSFSEAQQAMVVRDIQNLLFCRSKAEFDLMCYSTFQKWSASPELAEWLTTYFKPQWINNEAFCRWQIFNYGKVLNLSE